MILEWYKSQTEKDKSNFVLNLWIIFAVSGLMLIAAFIGEDHSDYFKAQNGLFLMCLIFLVLILIRRHGFANIYRNCLSFIKKDKQITLDAVTDLVFLSTTILVIVSFVFVLDLTFISDNGLRIGGVVSVIFASLFSSLRKTFKTK